MANTFGYVIMNSEPPLSQFMSSKFYIELLMKNNVVFDYSNISAIHLKKTYGINVKSFHFFDFPEYQDEVEPERNIDIFFVGTKTAIRFCRHCFLSLLSQQCW